MQVHELYGLMEDIELDLLESIDNKIIEEIVALAKALHDFIDIDYSVFLQYPRKMFTVKGAKGEGRDKPEDASRGPPGAPQKITYKIHYLPGEITAPGFQNFE